MNKVIFIGRISNDPDVRYTQDSKPVIRFNFAVPRKYKREGEPEADFFSCAVLGKPAESFEKLSIQKGTKLAIEGEMRNNNYTDKNGVKRYENQMIVSSFEFCESKSAGAGAAPAPKPEQSPDYEFAYIPDEVSDEGLPFA